MGTATIPFSNPAGNNQTSPASMAKVPTAGATAASPTVAATPTSATSTVNPYTPTATTAAPGTSTVAAGTGVATTAGTDITNQLTDIYGSGVGTALSGLLGSMSGTNSAVLQEYIASLVPQEAKAQANVNATLGAGGVSTNSSVAALADANLAAQEQASIAGESASLTQSQEQLTAQLLTGVEPAAAAETAQSGWSVFGDVLSGIGADAGSIATAIAKFK